MCGNASGARHLRRDGFLESAGMMHALSTPPAPLLEHHRSAALEPDCRHAAWQEIAHRWNDFEPAPDAPLQAELLLLGTDVTCLLGAAQSSAHEMHGGSPRALRDDVVVLSLLQAGGVRSSAYSRKGPGSLSLCDLRERHSYHWEHDTRQVFLTLPRQDAAAALGAEPTTRLLSTRCALAPALSSQMAHAALLLRQGGLDDAECAGLLEATRALALLTLRNLGRQGMAVDLPDAHETLHAGRYVAALRFMEQEAHRHTLDVAAIARAAGCSRTRLYEAFAARNQTVMGVLRDIRLQRAQGLLAQSRRLNVGALAWRCGFADASGFAKLFRARFGLSPTEWHARAQAVGLDFLEHS